MNDNGKLLPYSPHVDDDGATCSESIPTCEPFWRTLPSLV